MPRTFYVIGTDRSVNFMMRARGGWEPAHDITTADMVIWTGGQDINPALYHEPPRRGTHYSLMRDEEELAAYDACPESAIKAGICRGGQLLNVLSGGSMWQDIDGHIGTHDCQYVDQDGVIRIEQVTSLHHQMMKPGRRAEIWAVSALSTRRSSYYTEKHVGDYDRDGYDPEIIYYPHTNSVCFQGHPEYGHAGCTDLFFECVERAFERNQRGILGPEDIEIEGRAA